MPRRHFSVKIHPVGALALCAAMLFGSGGAALAAALALCLHETAHALCLWGFGVRECTIELTPFGGLADAPEYCHLRPGAQAVAALSGVLVSAAAGLLCARFAKPDPFWRAFLNANLSLALLNCLPVWPLDGARVVMAVASGFGAARVLRGAMLYLAYALAACMLGLGLYGAWHGRLNPSLFLLAPYLCYAARQSAMHGDIRAICALCTDKPGHGEILPLQARVCVGEPSRITLTRLAASFSAGRYFTLFSLDDKSYALRKIYTERDMAELLLDDREAGD